MSRGGRGGGGWGGGGGPNAAGKMGGQALPWEFDPDLESRLSTKPSEKFPPIPPPIAEPPSSYEKRIVAHYRTLRARIHDGPFYTVLDSSARISKTGQRSPPAAHFDPFDGRPTYSQRFVRKRNTLPRLSTRPFVFEFFPRELHTTLDPTSSGKPTKKSLHLSTRKTLDKWALLALQDGEAGGDDMTAGGHGGGDDDDNGDDNNNDDKNDDDQERDDDEDPDQFDEEDEDDDDDYNAEQYFDGGDDDDYGGDEGGGGGGDDDY